MSISPEATAAMTTIPTIVTSSRPTTPSVRWVATCRPNARRTAEAATSGTDARCASRGSAMTTTTSATSAAAQTGAAGAIVREDMPPW